LGGVTWFFGFLVGGPVDVSALLLFHLLMQLMMAISATFLMEVVISDNSWALLPSGGSQWIDKLCLLGLLLVS